MDRYEIRLGKGSMLTASHGVMFRHASSLNSASFPGPNSRISDRPGSILLLPIGNIIEATAQSPNSVDPPTSQASRSREQNDTGRELSMFEIMPSSPIPSIATAMTARSEQDCYELLLKELSSIPDREPPPPETTEASSQLELTPSSQVPVNTAATNSVITKTIRAAMADIKPAS
ncbi:hypothetical protein PT974_10108 [Cladobotryum mycophilum]|uniref:Uncharacterized protein n=1 Tax=Cladobotryum mycophilum TaxID=491253 RepID=A0ABR0S9U8_9HYPO